MKKLFCILLMLTILSTSAFAYYGYVTMYAPDGRTATVYAGDVAAWKAVGWFDSPVTVMYAPDGRTAYVGTNDVAAWKAVGWFDSPVTVMYAPDGRTAYVGKNDVAAWKAVGWFDSPVTVMYAPDGRTAYVGKNDVAAWKAVGWFDSPVKYIPSKETIALLTGTWENQGMTVTIYYKYSNIFDITVMIRDAYYPDNSFYGYYWSITATLDNNGTFTYTDGTKYYKSYRVLDPLNYNEKGQFKLCSDNKGFWLNWLPLNYNFYHNNYGYSF